MSPVVVLRCPAAVSALLISFSLLTATVQGSALLQRPHDDAAAVGIVHDDTAFMRRWDDPMPGTKAYAGFRERGVLDLTRRDCLPNGTNFCFGDSVNFCANCGTCCVDGIYCCGQGGVCCGTGCCASGQTCDQGQCLSSAGTVTVTAISYQTVTRTVTQIATVLEIVVDTSTLVQETEVTVSNEETQTNVVWVTETTLAKRGLPTAEVRLLARVTDEALSQPRRSWVAALRAAWTSIVPRGHLPHVVRDAPAAAPLHRRQATRDPLTAAAAPTVTNFVTETVEATRIISETITTKSTSVVMTTVFRTSTRVLNARTTIDVTSTLTITSHQPITQVITTTESPIITGPTGPASRTSSATSAPTIVPVASQPSSIQTPAIVGIAVGGTVAAVIVAAFVIFWFRYRRKNDPYKNGNPNADLPPNVNDLDMREPTYPALTHFTPDSSAAHHSVQFQPPPGGMAGLAAAAGVVYIDPDDPNKSSGGSSPLTQDHRTSSVYSTNYSTVAGAPGAGQPRDRFSAMTTASGRTMVSAAAAAMPPINGSAAEAPGSFPPGADWSEFDRTNNVSPAISAPSVAGRTSRRVSQQQIQQLQLLQQQRRHSRQHSYGSQPELTYLPNQLYPTPPEELDSNEVLEMGAGREHEGEGVPPRIPPRGAGRPTHLGVYDQTYDGASWGDPNSPGLQSVPPASPRNPPPRPPR